MYEYYKNIFEDFALPLAYVDADALIDNIKHLDKRVATEKKIRIATKSIRCTKIIDEIYKNSNRISGLMTYDANETLFLARKGYNNLLLGYPIYNIKYIDGLLDELKNGTHIIFMCDNINHVKNISQRAQLKNVKASICLDVDMSTKFPFLYFGVHRSPIKNGNDIELLLKKIITLNNISIVGLMGYEAQIAGVTDNVKNNFFKNHIIRFLKKISNKQVISKRTECVKTLVNQNCPLEFVNGGGTGSIEYTNLDPSVTEITVGSAFFCPALFDQYSNFKHVPAAGFALEITRNPEKKIYTTHGGGYIASGSTGSEKQPTPFLPEGLKILPLEGCGEVQTPLVYNGDKSLNIGDPIFLRHAKSGELCERFNELYLVSRGQILGRFNTYRGDGLCTL